MIAADTINQLYRRALHMVRYTGRIVAPRGMPTYERVGMHLELRQPAHNIIVSPARKLNYHFMMAEWLWMMLGQNDVESISYFNSVLRNFSDDGVTFSGAYGPKLTEQLPYVIDALKRDASSRQAVLTIWRERPAYSRDIPCTALMQFFERDGAIDCIVYMRSNDLMLGFPYDVFNFTMIQRYIADALKRNIGTYHHMVGSLHLYQKDADKAAAIINEDVTWDPRCSDPTYPIPAVVRGWFNRLAVPPYDPTWMTLDDNQLEIRNALFATAPTPWYEYLSVLLAKTAPAVKSDMTHDPWHRLFNDPSYTGPRIAKEDEHAAA